MRDPFLYTNIDSPVGPLLIGMDEAGLRFVDFQTGPRPLEPRPTWRRVNALPCDAVEQLRAYFAGELRQFDLLLAPEGTTFQLEVWAVVEEIPYGQTLSYATLAHRIGRPGAARAVGAANAQNPLPIIVPCHRVIGSSGALTGYAGGLRIKQALLALERKYRSQSAEQLTLL
jgi:methylated-DNA-[protein]-cysteine S-methyltransferase